VTARMPRQNRVIADETAGTMNTFRPMSHLRRSVVGVIAVLGIVLASAIGLHEWADDAVVRSMPHHAVEEDPGI
jgi:hypothetical protein